MQGIIVICVSGINRQEEYCLSSTRILTSRNQPVVDNRVKIECTSNVVDVMNIPLSIITLSFNVGSMRLFPECP